MSKVSPGINKFTSGELSSKMDGRTETPQYAAGCKKLENFVIHPQGGAARRPGTKFIASTYGDGASRLIPFEYNVEQTYAIEFGYDTTNSQGVARFITNDGLLATEDRNEFAQDQLLSIGWGTPDPSSGVTTSVSFSNDGLKVYFQRFTEEKTGSTHTLKLAIRQYNLTNAHNITTADASSVVEREWTFEDRFAANVADGERKFHAGMFFHHQGTSSNEGSALYLWDGMPDVDITAFMSGTGNKKAQIFRFDLTTDWDISSTTSGLLYGGSPVYDYLRSIGMSTSEPGTRKPIPIAGMGIQVAHNTAIGNYSNRGYAASDISTDGEVGYLIDYITTSYSRYRDGDYLYFLVSHLATASECTIVESGGTTEVNPGGIIVNSLMDTSGPFSNNYPRYQFDNLIAFPTNATSQENPAYVHHGEVLYQAPSGSSVTRFHGLQMRSARDLHLTLDDGRYAHDVYPYPSNPPSNTKFYDIISTNNVNGTQNHHQLLSVALIGYTRRSGETCAAICKLNYWTSGGHTHASTVKGNVFTFVSELTDPSIALVDTSSPKSLYHGHTPHITYDGQKIFWSDGLLPDGATNLLSYYSLKHPMLGLYIDEDHTSFNVSDYDSSPAFTHAYTSVLNQFTNPVLEIPHPYTLAQLSAVRYAQSADVLYLVHPDVKPQKLIRYGASAWGIGEVNFVRGPMQDPFLDGTTLTASGRTGSVTLTANANVFSTTDVGRLVKVHDGYAEITAVSSTVSATATVKENEDRRSELMPSYTATTIAFHEGDPTTTNLEHNDRITDSAGNFVTQGFKVGQRITVSGSIAYNNQSGLLLVSVTADTLVVAPSGELDPAAAGASVTITGDLDADDEFRLGAFSDTTGYPACVSFYEQRLVFANTLVQPQTIFFSTGNSFEEFTPGVDANDAIIYTIGSNQVNVIEYLAGSRFLIVGTSGGEFSVSSGTTTEPITPSNAQIRKQSGYGSKSIEPLSVANVILFVQRAGRKLRELSYNYDTDSYFAPDMTILAEHITEGLIKRITLQQEPDNIVWAVLEDGSLCGMTYRREEEVVGWHSHAIGGTNTFVEDVLSIPSGDTQDDLYLIVRRTINSETKRYIERLTNIDFGNDVEDAWFVDSALQYEGASATIITGLNHLEGETVQILGNGSVQASKTVSSGQITLDTAVTKATIGLGYDSTLQTMRLDYGGDEGTAQGKTKRIRDVTVRFYRTVGAKVGPDAATLDTIEFRDSSVPMGQPTPLYDGDKEITFPSGYETDGFVVVKQDQALPMTVVGIFPRLQTFDR